MSNMSDKWGQMAGSAPSTPEDLFKATVAKIESILKYRNNLTQTFGGNVESIENSYRIAKDQLDKSLINLTVSVQPHELQSIHKTVDIMTDIYIMSDHTKIYMDLSRELVRIFFSWNISIGKDKSLERKLKLLDKMLEMRLTLDETIWVMKNLIGKAREILQVEPAAFKLSKHYLDSLEGTKDEKS